MKTNEHGGRPEAEAEAEAEAAPGVTVVPAYPIDGLEPHPRNPRRGDIDAIRESIRAFGFFGAVYAQRRAEAADGSPQKPRIIAGEHRWRAARAEGLREIPVRLLDVDDAQALAILLVDNRAADRGTYDEERLLEALRQQAELATLYGTAYSEDYYRALLERHAAPPAEPPEEAPPPGEAELRRLAEKWGTAPGQVWAAGPHKLAVGDATDETLVRALMDGSRAEAMWTDPPYGVAYEGGTGLTIENDALDEDALARLLGAALRVAQAVLRPGSPVYVAHPAGPLSLTFGAVIEQAGWAFHQTLTWAKDRFVLGRCDYHFAHEPVIYASTPPGDGGPEGGHAELPWHAPLSEAEAPTTWQEIPRPSRSELHPTMKPVALVAGHLEASTAPGDLVYEPFAGSGTTIVACHHTGRRARAVELDPLYAAGTLERLAELGLEPRLAAEAPGRTP